MAPKGRAKHADKAYTHWPFRVVDDLLESRYEIERDASKPLQMIYGVHTDPDATTLSDTPAASSAAARSAEEAYEEQKECA
eukprot:7388188-Prymnesium_polylepis.1